MKHIFTLLIFISLIFSPILINAQVRILNGADEITSPISFCSNPTLSVDLNESKTGANWNYYFPNSTGNIITLNLNNGFTFGNNSVNTENEVKCTPLARTSSSVMFSSLTKLNTPHY